MTYSWKRNLTAVWIGAFLMGMAYSVSIPFMSIFLQKDLGVNEHLETWTGVVFAVTFLGSSLIAPFWGSVADKYGRKPMMLRAGLCLSLTYFLYFFVQNPYELLAVRVLDGLLSGYIPSAIALVATNTPEKHVGHALGILSTASASASVLGPLLGGVVSHFVGPRDTFMLAAAMVFIAFLIALFWVKEPTFNKLQAKRSSVFRDLQAAVSNRKLISALIIVFITSTSIMILEPLLTIYVIELGSGQDAASLHAGIIFSAIGVATLIAAPRWGKVGASIGYEKVLFIGLLGGGIGNLLQIAFHDLIGFGSLRFVYGLFFAAVFPALNSFIATQTSPEFRSRAFGLNQSANQMGLLIGPLLGGVLASHLPITAIFALNGGLLLMVALLTRMPALSLSGVSRTDKP